MKKILFYLVSALFMSSFFSCSQDSESFIEPTSAVKMQEVAFDLKENGFDQVNLRTTPLSGTNLKSLHYLVYGSDGLLVKTKKFFGGGISDVKDTLAFGNYKVVFIATDAVKFDENFMPDFHPIYNSAYIRKYMGMGQSRYDNDVFFAQFDLNVGTSTVKKETVLSRIVGKVEVLPLDIQNTPKNLLSINLYVFEGFPNHFYFDGERTVWEGNFQGLTTCSPKYNREDFMKINAQNPILFTGFPAKIQSLGPNKGYYLAALYYLKDSPNIGRTIILKRSFDIEKNKTLKLSGNLFSGTLNTDDIQVNNEWGATIENSFD